MYTKATVLGLAGLAAAGAPAAYGSSAPAGYPAPSTSVPAVYGSASASASYSAFPSGSASYSYSFSAIPSSGFPSASASYSGYPSGSVSYSAYPSSSGAPTPPGAPSCWTSCFSKNGVTSEADLCGNTAVDACIQQDCSCEEDRAYWEWYEGYCPATSSSSVVYSATPSSGFVTYSVTSASASASATPDCWSECFAKYEVTSEASLCNNDDVSQCIHTTCSAALDKAYWMWYNGYCSAPAVTTAYTTEYTTVCPYSSVYTSETSTLTSYGSTTSTVTTTIYSTSEIPSTPKSPVGGSGLPSPPPYAPTSPATTSGWGAATTGSAVGAYPTGGNSTSWVPVAATGDAGINKPAAILFAGAMALLALF